MSKSNNIATVLSRALDGLRTIQVRVEVQISAGLPGIHLVGLPETAVRESKERVRSAIISSGFEFPLKRITINLAPADFPKKGGRFDLAIAMGILCASGQIPFSAIHKREFIGELSLGGGIAGIAGATASTLGAHGKGNTIALSTDSLKRAQVVDGAKILPARTLLQMCQFTTPPGQATNKVIGRGRSDKDIPSLESNVDSSTHEIIGASPTSVSRTQSEAEDGVDLLDVRGRQFGKRALEIAAVGNHHMMIVGPPGCGKTMLSKRLISILPPLNDETALTSSMIFEAANITPEEWGLPPIRAPHHTATLVSICGGGNPVIPGEISLAHGGVLLLDETLEFSRTVLEALRQPAESREISIARANRRQTYPAACQILLTMNPCPCGYLGSDKTCTCHPNEMKRYIKKLSGPLMDRIDLRLSLGTIPQQLLTSKEGESSAVVAKRVLIARKRSKARLGFNAALSDKELKMYCNLNSEDSEYLRNIQDKMLLSDRFVGRVLRLSRSIADMQPSENISRLHLTEALTISRLPPPFDNSV